MARRLRRIFRPRVDPINALLREAWEEAQGPTALGTDDPEADWANPTTGTAEVPADSATHTEATGGVDDHHATWIGDSRDVDRVAPVVIGVPSTFGSADWWRSDWWPLTASGDARDIQADLGTLGDLAIAAVTSRGHKHRLEGSSCEDAFHLRAARATTAEFAVVAVCDGVGSAPHASLGSQKLSRAATDGVVEELVRGSTDLEAALTDAIRNGVARVSRFAEQQGYNLRDLETTLTVAIVPTAPGATSAALIGWIGDSPAFLGQGRSWRCLMQEVDNEAVASSATRGALTARPEDLTLAHVQLQPGERLLLSSDGVGSFVVQGERNLALGDHLAVALTRPVDLATLMRHATFDLRSADDDRTLVLVWKAPVDDESKTP